MFINGRYMVVGNSHMVVGNDHMVVSGYHHIYGCVLGTTTWSLVGTIIYMVA